MKVPPVPVDRVKPMIGHVFRQGTLDALKVKLAGHSKTIQLGLLRVSTNFSLGTGVTSAVFYRKTGQGKPKSMIFSIIFSMIFRVFWGSFFKHRFPG